MAQGLFSIGLFFVDVHVHMFLPDIQPALKVVGLNVSRRGGMGGGGGGSGCRTSTMIREYANNEGTLYCASMAMRK